MKLDRGAILAIALLPIMGAPAGAEFNPDAWKVRQSRMVLREATVSAGQQDVRIEVYTEPERQGWGRQLADWATQLVPALYQRFGPPAGIESIQIIEETDLPSFGWNGLKKGVRLRFPADAAELAHQLVHYWIHPGTVADPWLQKGVAGWEGLMAMRAAGMPLAAEAEWQSILLMGRENWADRDFPLSEVELHAESAERFAFGRAKATLYIALLNTAFGDRGYSDWVKGLATRDKALDMDGLKKDMKDVGRDPASLLPGWVVGGAYAAYRWKDFDDKDNDGIPDALESMLGTNAEDADSDHDRLSDGFEFWSNFNPADKDTMGDNKMDSERVGLAVDGLGADWQIRNLKPAFSDAAGDGNKFDLTDVYTAADAGFFYLRLDTAKPVDPTADYWISLFVDTDKDKKADVVAIGDDAGRSWYARYRKGAQIPEAGDPHPGLRINRSRTTEFALPLDLLEGKRSFSFNIRIDTPQGTQAIDNIGGYWHKVDLANIGIR